MSWWDRYFAPGDIRQRKALEAQLAAKTLQENSKQSPQVPQVQRIDAAHRARRQSALLFGGLAFTALSLVVTRRTLRRKNFQIQPQQFSPSNGSPSKVDGSLEAVEALGLATLNVFSIAMASAGAAMTYFDIADVEDMRDMVRKAAGSDIYGGDEAADKELETWAADVLAKNEGQSGFQRSIAEKLLELDKKEKERKASKGQ
jgi:hypothetical protein